MFFSRALFLLVFFVCPSSGKPLPTHTSHGIARFDDLKYPADFSHFDYVNPEAPKGGSVKTIGVGTFESVNPYTKAGLTPLDVFPFGPLGMGYLFLNEPLMAGAGLYAPSGDEPRSAYGLIAESAEYPDDNGWIIFNLRREATFHDGKPITADDVVFSFSELKDKGHVKYRQQLSSITSVEKLSTHRVRFNFANAGPRDQLFHAAEVPVLPAHYWQGKTLGKSSMTAPLNSGPYIISNIEPGSSITLTRKKDYWGKDLPINKGKYNFDKIILYYHRDPHMALQAFQGGDHDVHIEQVGKNWALEYDFPAVKSGQIKITEIPTKLIIGCPMLVFNTRHTLFKDIRVREAISLMFDFEWTNRTLFYDAYLRSNSYFPNSVYAHHDRPSDKELALLTPWQKQLPKVLFTTPFSPPVTKGDGNIRDHQLEALDLLEQAGWKLHKGRLVNQKNQPFEFEVLSYNHSFEKTYSPFIKNLNHLGMNVRLRILDMGVYVQRIRKLDFHMIAQAIPFGLTIGNELTRYFHSDFADTEDTKNLAGIKNPVVDHLVEQLPKITSQQELITLAHSLDRVLLWNHYGIPLWYYGSVRLAYKNIYQWPETVPDFPMFLNTWWVSPEHHKD